MTAGTLGRLTRVDPRDIWMSEAADFTPWLAREENLAVLAETLGIELELEAQERAVGPFRADLLCKDIGSNAWVLVENQLERTDHTHLGQLLTYASGLEAVTIVWIAGKFTEEHRATLDWLNKVTDESIRFFGLEVELWRIADSPAAPKFNVISKPNDWSRSVADAARAIDDSELSAIRAAQRAYWTAFHSMLDRIGGPISGNRKAQLQSWMAYPIGRSGFSLNAAMLRPRRQVRAELYITGSNAKTFFHNLKEQDDDIAAELGYPLVWEELPAGRDSRVSVYLDDVDTGDQSDWERQHEWLARRLTEMHRVLSRRVRQLESPSRAAGHREKDTIPGVLDLQPSPAR
ncbi:DUF4268 domain-containing protein [Marinimicrococcus flavescens]|uniref:DUF4268 domain-containing protein n=1 Tax=Marinimicrococcus flavescens TaxID=3031815 RepID=A0AAP3XRY4_9PROT|nr:DUF4268 domain-containing protein [Marinimicrococcus flavescens]